MENYREYLIKDNDTIESIALYERGDVSAWREIVLINGLDFPFVVAEKETSILAVRDVKASGMQTFAVTSAKASVVQIPKGVVLEVQRAGLRDLGDRAPRYYTTADGILPIGSLTTTIPIESETSGDWGNTLANTIVKFVENGSGQVLLQTGIWVAKPAVDSTYNAEDILNGKRRNIKTTGETILIPSGLSAVPVVADTSTYEERFGRIDLALDVNGDIMVDGKTGDIATVSGYQNIAQSLFARLSTRRRELKRYPWYGSNSHNYVGRSGKYIIELIKMDVITTCKQDARVEDVMINALHVEKDKLYLDSVDIKLVGQSKKLTIRNKAITLV